MEMFTLELNVWNVMTAWWWPAEVTEADDFVRIMSLANAISFYLRWTEFMKMNTICTEMNTNILDTQTGIVRRRRRRRLNEFMQYGVAR